MTVGTGVSEAYLIAMRRHTQIASQRLAVSPW
jgi:hypothetical protein